MKRVLGIFCIAFGAVLLFVGGFGTILALANQRGGGDHVIALGFGIIAAVGLLTLLVAWRLMRNSPPIGIVPKPVEGRVGNYLANVPEAREQNGVNYEVQYLAPISGKNGRPSALHVRLPVKAPTTLLFTRETWFDRLCKQVGIAREHQSGDAAFDEAIYVRCPSEGYAELYLADADRRAAVLALRKLGYRDVQLTGTQAVAHWPSFDPAKHDHPELSAATADLLNLLAKNAPADDPDNAAAQFDTRRSWLLLFWIGILGYAVTLFGVAAWPPIHTSALLLTAGPLFVGGFVLFAWVSAYFLSGTSTAHDRWLPLMIVGLLCHGLGSVGTTAMVNALGDTAAPVERAPTIVDKRSHTSSGKNKKTTYYVKVPAWEPGGDAIEFSVSLGEYNQTVPGRSKLHLVTSPGRLGVEWLKSKAVTP